MFDRQNGPRFERLRLVTTVLFAARGTGSEGSEDKLSRETGFLCGSHSYETGRADCLFADKQCSKKYMPPLLLL